MSYHADSAASAGSAAQSCTARPAPSLKMGIQTHQDVSGTRVRPAHQPNAPNTQPCEPTNNMLHKTELRRLEPHQPRNPCSRLTYLPQRAPVGPALHVHRRMGAGNGCGLEGTTRAAVEHWRRTAQPEQRMSGIIAASSFAASFELSYLVPRSALRDQT